MTQLIVKSPYLPPNSTGKIEGYLRYISTREGVEQIKKKDSVAYSDEDRKDIINELLKLYPDSVDFLEYKDFEKNPSRENADELITQITESHADFFSDRGTYLKYISERPRVQIVSKTGLFSDAEMDLNISRISREISESQSNVWTHIISLKREDAQRLGYDSVENWIPLLRSERNFIAQQMNIKPDNFRWYAAFHNESHHPHVHMVAYSVEPNEAFLNADGISNIKGELTKHIFRQDLMCLYDKQNESRDNLRQVGEQQIYDIIKQVNSRLYDNPKIEALLVSLSEYLSDYEGKKVYGYFSTKGKRIVNSIIDEMEKDPIISDLYKTWYSYKEQIIDIYSNKKLVRVSLSQNKDFKTIKNAIIKAAANLSIESIDEKEYEKDSIFQPDIPNDCYVEKAEVVEETAINNIVTDNDIKHSEDYLSLKASAERGNVWEQYKMAKYLLDDSNLEYNPTLALSYMYKSASQGLSIAEYMLGKLLIVGADVEQDVLTGIAWLEKAASERNSFALYFLGKTYLQGIYVEQDIDKAITYLYLASKESNHFAEYTLGKLLIDGKVVQQDVSAGLDFIKKSADGNFKPAQYYYGKLLFMGEFVNKNIPLAIEYLTACVDDDDKYASYLLGRIYQTEQGYVDYKKAIEYFVHSADNGNDFAYYQLGKMYLYGLGVDSNLSQAVSLLQISADMNNQYAQLLLKRISEGKIHSCSSACLSLFYQLGRLFKKNVDNRRKADSIKNDKKLMSKIQEKKIAHGLKM